MNSFFFKMEDVNEILKLREEVKVLRKKIDEISQEKSNLLYLLGNNSNEVNSRSL